MSALSQNEISVHKRNWMCEQIGVEPDHKNGPLPYHLMQRFLKLKKKNPFLEATYVPPPTKEVPVITSPATKPETSEALENRLLTQFDAEIVAAEKRKVTLGNTIKELTKEISTLKGKRKTFAKFLEK